MKRIAIALAMLAIVATGCAPATVYVVVTATPASTAAATATLLPPPTVTNLPTMTSMPPAAGVTVDQIKQAFVAAGLPLSTWTVFDAASDPNHLLGRPGGYVAKASWLDTRISSPGDTIDNNSGTVEIFANASDLQARATYFQAFQGTMFGRYVFSHGLVLLALDYKLTPDQEKGYEDALKTLP